MKPTREHYRTEYRGIDIELSRHFSSDREVWCFYLLLILEGFPEEYVPDLTRPVRVTDYGSIIQPHAECLQDLKWHSGMTFYEVTVYPGQPFTSIKAGCDYDHAWDENQYYSAETVMSDAKDCVDSLLRTFPSYKTRRELWDEYRAPFNEAMKQKESTK